MNINHLIQFVNVAETGSFREAARVMGLTQSAITKSFRVLEEELGVPLVERTSSGATLTDYGRQLLAHAKTIRNEIDVATRSIKEMASGTDVFVRFGCAGVASTVLLPKTIPFFRSRYPGSRIEIVGGLPYKLIPQLIEGALEFVVGPKTSSPLPPSIEQRLLFRSKSVIIVRKGHILAGATELRQFSKVQWILTEEAADITSEFRLALLDATGPDISILVTTDDPFLSDRLVANTDAVSLMRRHMLKSNLVGQDIVPVALPDACFNDQIMLYTRRANRHSPSAQQFIDAIVTHALSVNV